MGRPVFPDPNRVVRKDVYDRLTHQSTEPKRRTQVVAEDQKGAAVRLKPAVQGHPVHGRGHGVLPYPESKVPPLRHLRLKVTPTRDVGLVRPAEVRRAADEVFHLRRELVEREAAGLSGGDLLARLE